MVEVEIPSGKRGYFRGQYFCFSKEKFPKDMYDIFLSRNKNPLKLEKISNIRFVDIQEHRSHKTDYLYGKVVFKAKFDDFDYEVEGTNLIKKHKVNEKSFELPFILEPEGKKMLFFNRDEADKYGRKIISHIAFSNGDIINNLTFDIKRIREAKKKGVFENIWMNSVASNGKIRKQQQFGENIDTDTGYLDGSKYDKKGIGIVVKTHINDKTKVSVYESGTISICRSYNKFEDNLKMYFTILKQFLPYSNYDAISSL